MRGIRKITAMVLLLCAVIGTTALADSSTSDNFYFEQHHVRGYLNTKSWNTAEASTDRVSGPENITMYVCLYANSVNGNRIKTSPVIRAKQRAYVREYALGSERDPLYVWQSQHSVSTKNDGYYYLTLFS